MEEQKISMLTYDDIERSECFSGWKAGFHKELKSRRYAQPISSPLQTAISDWLYAHRDEIWDISLEETEKRMIEDGVLTPDDI